MNGVLRQMLRLSPNLIERIPENGVNDKDIDFAIDRGYKPNSETPIHLFSNARIANLYYELDNSLNVTRERFNLIVSHIDILNKFVSANSLSSLSNRSYFSEIESTILEKINDLDVSSLDSFTENSVISYIEGHKDTNILSSIKVNISDYDRFYVTCRDNNASIPREMINKEMLVAMINNGISVGSLSYNEAMKDEDVASLVISKLQSNEISVEELANSPFKNNNSILVYLMNKSIENIKYFGSYNDAVTIVLNKFKSELPESLKYVKVICDNIDSYKTEFYEEFTKILIEENYVITEKITQEKILNNKEIILNSIINNPQILNVLDLRNRNYEFTVEEVSKIANAITENNIPVQKYSYLITSNEEIYKAVLRINPQFINLISNGYGGLSSEIINILEESGYTMDNTSPAALFDYRDLVIKSLEKSLSVLDNPKFDMNFGQNFGGLEDCRRIYDLIKSKGYTPTMTSPKALFNNPYILIDALENKTITLDNIEYISYSIYKPELVYSYIALNYSEDEYDVIKSRMKELHTSKKEFLYRNIINNLTKDFSLCINYSDFAVIDDSNRYTNEPEQFEKELFKLYKSNPENRQYLEKCKLLRNNKYIRYYELTEYNNDIIKDSSNSWNRERYYYISYLGKKEEIIELIREKKVTASYNMLHDLFFYDINISEELYDRVLESVLASEDVKLIAEIIKRRAYKGDYADEFFDRYFSNIKEEGHVHFSNYNDDAIDIIINRAKSDNELYKIILISLCHSNSDKYHKLIISELRSGNLLLSSVFYSLKDELTPEDVIEAVNNNPDNIQYLNNFYIRRKGLLENPILREIYNKAIEDKIIFLKTRKYSDEELILLATRDNSLLVSKDFIEKVVSENITAYDELHKLTKEFYLSGGFKIYDSSYNYLGLLLKYGTVDLDVLQYAFNNREDIYKLLAIDNTFLNTPEVLGYLETYERLYANKELHLGSESRSKVIRQLSYEKRKELLEIRGDDVFSTGLVSMFFDDLEAYQYCSNNIEKYDLERTGLYENSYIRTMLLNNHPELLKYVFFDYANEDAWAIDFVFNIYEMKYKDMSIYDYHCFFDNPKIYNKYFNVDTFVFNDVTFSFTRDLAKFNPDLLNRLFMSALKRDITTIRFLYYINEENETFLNQIYAYLEEINFDISQIERSISNEKILTLSLKNNFKATIDKYGEVSREEEQEYLEKVSHEDYVITSTTPKYITRDKDLCMKSFKIDPVSIKYFDDKVIDSFDYKEREQIIKYLIDSEVLYDVDMPLFVTGDSTYIKYSISKDIKLVDVINDTSFSSVEKGEMIKLVKDNIKSGNYTLSIYSPSWLFVDSELLMEAYRTIPNFENSYNCPPINIEVQRKLFEEGIETKNNPYFILNVVSNNIESIDDISLPDISYPSELVDEIVKVLIENNYVVSDNTNEVFMTDELVMYAIKNNMPIKSNIKKRFLTLENMFKYQDKELFMTLLDENSMGVLSTKMDNETLYELASKFGGLLSFINFTEFTDDYGYEEFTIENIESYFKRKLAKGRLSISAAELVISRTDMYLSDKDINDGFACENDRLYISFSTKIFETIINQNPNRVLLYRGSDDYIFTLALKRGYVLSENDYISNEMFRKSRSISRFIINEHPEMFAYCKCVTDEMYKYALSKGYKLNIEDFRKSTNFACNDLIIKDMLIIDPSAIKYISWPESYMDEAIKNGYEINIDDYRKTYNFNDSDSITKMMMEKDASCIKYYSGYNKDELYKLAVEVYKYELTREDYIESSTFRNNNYITELALNLDVQLFSYYEGNNELLIPLAVSLGYKPDEKALEKQYFTKSDEIISIAITMDSKYILKYCGTNSNLITRGLIKYIDDYNDINIIDTTTLIFGDEVLEYVLERGYIISDKSPNSILNNRSIVQKFFNKSVEGYANKDRIVEIASLIGPGYCMQLINSKILSDEIFNYFNNQEIQKIIKYLYYAGYKDNLEELMNNNDLNLFKELNSLFVKYRGIDSLDPRFFTKYLKVYSSSKTLCRNVINSEYTSKDINLLYELIDSESCQFNLLETLEDLRNYRQVIYDKNKHNIDNSYTVNSLKEVICQSLCNMTYYEIQKFLDQVFSTSRIDELMESITDENLKSELANYRVFIELIETIISINDIERLKNIATKLNEKKRDNDKDLNDIWEAFSGIELKAKRFYGAEIEEHLLDLDDVKDKPGIVYKEGFYGSGKVDYIELDGHDFIMFAHVLNAYGSGATISDFKNPRLIGKTYICLSALGEENFGTAARAPIDKDHVTVLFTKISSDRLALASHRDLGSGGSSNDLNLHAHGDNNFRPVRKVISETYTGSGGYNEYVMYRDNLKGESIYPTAILVTGDEPVAAEIEAAEYLGVPLVKINKNAYTSKASSITTREIDYSISEERLEHLKEAIEAIDGIEQIIEGTKVM